MTRCLGIAVCLMACSISLSAAPPDPPVKPKAVVELRWLESNHVKGLTEDWGVTIMCGPVLAYPHQKPVLTNADIARVSLANVDLSSSGLAKNNYMLTFHLTDEAKKKLAGACGDEPERMLTVLVDGKSWGMRVYRKADAARFLLQAGFLSSKSEAERIVRSFE